MREMHQFYIGGQWVDPEVLNPLDVINPATEKPCGSISQGSHKDIGKAVAAAKDAAASFATSPREKRLELLQAILDGLVQRSDEIAETITEEMGAPLGLAQAAQVPSGIQHFRTILKALANYEFETHQGTTRIIREAIGPCALITPWNWPLNQVAAKVAPALAAGCTMILKPSEIAPFNSLILAEIIHDASVPAGVFNLVNGDGTTVGSTLTAHPDIAMVSFTGSTRAGVDVAKKAAHSVKRLNQELGGKSANLILDDADLKKAVARGVSNCFSNSGQSCNAPTRMLVPKKFLKDATKFAIERAKSTVVGDPQNKKSEIGPVASEVQWKKIQGFIEKGIEEGATLAVGGLGRPYGLKKGYYVQPTVFSDVSNDMTIAREEIFGPVLSIIPYKDDDDAIHIANDTPYGLSGYVSSSNIHRARNIASQLRTGMVHINNSPLDFAAPFGGYKQSGNGREWGTFGIDEYLEIKSVYGFEEQQ